jgi:ubiquitin-conjugating enzyme E2 Z
MAPSTMAMRRILRDVQVVTILNASQLGDDGIYYHANESDATQGTALLIGQKDTPYFGGFYFFDIKFPDDYPFSPIKVRTLTQDGRTRFNPNMYVEGKVCLSILNTWHDGPQWSGVQTLESVLRVIMSDVLHDNPIINEPAYRSYPKTHQEAQIYNRMIWSSNLFTAVCAQLKQPPPWAVPFLDIMRKSFNRNYDELVRLGEESEIYDGKTETCRMYQMTALYNFRAAVEKLNAQKS